MSARRIPGWEELAQEFVRGLPAGAACRRIEALKDPTRYRVARRWVRRLAGLVASASGDPGYLRFARASWEELVDLLRDQVARNEALESRGLADEPVFAVAGMLELGRRHNQLPCTRENLGERADWVERLCERRLPVLLVGDDDRLGLELARRGFSDLTVIDIDEPLLRSLENQAEAEGLRIRFEHHDLSQPPPARLVRDYSLVTMDPICTPAGVRLFVSGGMAFVRPGHPCRVLVCTHLLSQLRDGLSQLPGLLESHRLELEELRPGFAVYPSPPASIVLLKAIISLVDRGLSRQVPRFFVSDAMVLARR